MEPRSAPSLVRVETAAIGVQERLGDPDAEARSGGRGGGAARRGRSARRGGGSSSRRQSGAADRSPSRASMPSSTAPQMRIGEPGGRILRWRCRSRGRAPARSGSGPHRRAAARAARSTSTAWPARRARWRSSAALTMSATSAHSKRGRSPSLADAGRVEQVLDHVVEPLGLLAHHVGQRLELGVGGDGGRAGQHRGGAEDRGERRAQLVRHRSDQRVAQLLGLGAPARLVDGALGGLGMLLDALREPARHDRHQAEHAEPDDLLPGRATGTPAAQAWRTAR